jgi:hypothetical protein
MWRRKILSEVLEWIYIGEPFAGTYSLSTNGARLVAVERRQYSGLCSDPFEEAEFSVVGELEECLR